MATYYPRYYFKDAVGTAASSVAPRYHERLIDFAVRNITTSDSANMIAIPDNTLVLGANYQTLATVTDATSSFAITSETANINYVTAAVAVAAGLFGVPAAISADRAQKWYAAKDDIRIKTVTVADLTAGKIKVFAVMVHPEPYVHIDADGNTRTRTFTDRNNWTTTEPTI